MNDRALILSGATGAITAAICCTTPLLVVLLPAIGLGTWLATADVILIPLFFAGLGLVALGLYRRRAATCAACETKPDKEGLKP
jgi:mercuric ion transport protein